MGMLSPQGSSKTREGHIVGSTFAVVGNRNLGRTHGHISRPEFRREPAERNRKGSIGLGATVVNRTGSVPLIVASAMVSGCVQVVLTEMDADTVVVACDALAMRRSSAAASGVTRTSADRDASKHCTPAAREWSPTQNSLFAESQPSAWAEDPDR